MAVNRVPVLKRCRSLGLDPIYLGIDKKSTRQLKRANRKVSEYGLQLRLKLPDLHQAIPEQVFHLLLPEFLCIFQNLCIFLYFDR